MLLRSGNISGLTRSTGAESMMLLNLSIRSNPGNNWSHSFFLNQAYQLVAYAFISPDRIGPGINCPPPPSFWSNPSNNLAISEICVNWCAWKNMTKLVQMWLHPYINIDDIRANVDAIMWNFVHFQSKIYLR